MERFRRTVAIAVAVHASAFVLLPRLPREGASSETSAPRTPADEWEIALDSATEPRRIASAASAQPDLSDEPRTSHLAARDTGEAGRRPEVVEEPSRNAPVAAPLPSWSFSVMAPPSIAIPLGTPLYVAKEETSTGGAPLGNEIGVGGDADASSRPATPGSSKERSTILRDGLHASDMAKGRALGNPVLRLAREVTMQQPSPVVGEVVFEVRVDGKGHVVDVRIRSCDGDCRAWDAVKHGLREALRDHPIHVLVRHA